MTGMWVTLRRVAVFVTRVLVATGRWVPRHWRWSGCWALLAVVFGDSARLLPVLVPALLCGFCSQTWPVTYERYVAGPSRRLGWRWRMRRRWPAAAQVCGLERTDAIKNRRTGKTSVRVIVPKLRRVRAHGATVTLSVRPRPGQTVEDVIEKADRIATTYGAQTYRAHALHNTLVAVELTMADLLTVASYGAEPAPVGEASSVGLLPLGRTQAGREWVLSIRSRHTLCAGSSGSGKGSVLWGICTGLAPAVSADLVRLWGIDLKGGVEIETGAPLFSATAYDPAAAVEVLRRLQEIVDQRTAVMRGQSRDFTPSPGDPLHVLVIDELAVLVSYAEVEVRREAERRLSHLLAVGRAVGVVVVAFVQDPRKDVVSMRNLFNQRVALRLMTSDETAMVLGDGMARLAPAHRINRAHPGTGWVVDETGNVDRVRAHYWPDQAIRAVSSRYATSVRVDLTPQEDGEDQGTYVAATPRPRKPRAPRQPRQTATVVAGVDDTGEAA